MSMSTSNSTTTYTYIFMYVCKYVHHYVCVYLSLYQQRYDSAHKDVTWEANMWITTLMENESVQISSVGQSCLTLYDLMNHSTPGLPVHHQLTEFTQTHLHWVSDAIQRSHPLSSPSPPASNPSQHQSLFQWVNSSHEVAKGLEFQL